MDRTSDNSAFAIGTFALPHQLGVRVCRNLEWLSHLALPFHLVDYRFASVWRLLMLAKVFIATISQQSLTLCPAPSPCSSQVTTLQNQILESLNWKTSLNSFELSQHLWGIICRA